MRIIFFGELSRKPYIFFRHVKKEFVVASSDCKNGQEAEEESEPELKLEGADLAYFSVIFALAAFMVFAYIAENIIAPLF